MMATPAQCGMILLLGGVLGMAQAQPMTERIRRGRKWLADITGQDFGYDAQRWHEYLWETDVGGYRWSRRSKDKWGNWPLEAMDNPEWQAAVKELEALPTSQPPAPNPPQP